MDVKNSRNDGEVEERPNMAADLGRVRNGEGMKNRWKEFTEELYGEDKREGKYRRNGIRKRTGSHAGRGRMGKKTRHRTKTGYQ